MEAENKAVAAIVDNPDAPTFENTIEALETSGELLERATTLMYNLLSAHTNDDLEDLAQRVAPFCRNTAITSCSTPAFTNG